MSGIELTTWGVIDTDIAVNKKHATSNVLLEVEIIYFIWGKTPPGPFFQLL